MRRLIYILMIAFLLAGVVALAQNYAIDWYVIASGGGHSESDGYQVDGTIGQPIVGMASSEEYIIEAGFWVGAGAPPSCVYVPGDINGDGNVMGNDVTYGVRYFKGLGDPPPDSCQLPDESWLYVAGDVNGSCTFLGNDITYLVMYFKGMHDPNCVDWCSLFPPPDPPDFVCPPEEPVLSMESDTRPVGLLKK